MKIRGLTIDGKWTPEEVAELQLALAALPHSMVEDNPCLHSIIRRDVLTNAPPEAPGHSMYNPESGSIVVFDKGVYHGDQISPEQFRRSIYHELAHSLLQSDDALLQRWVSSTKGDGFVDEYATSSPDEDFADTFSEFFLHRKQLEKIAPTKAEFINALLEPQEKVAMAHISGFLDELVKLGAPGLPPSLMARLAGKVPGLGRTAALAGGVGIGTYLLGKRKGKEQGETQGVEEGMQGADQGMQQAYAAGVQRGAAAMRAALARQEQPK